jgi:protoheme IX farnesyltransferase
MSGYLSVKHTNFEVAEFIALTISLGLAISGSTVLNMWYDRDIDSQMKRTCWRPLPAGKVRPNDVLMLGLFLSFCGVSWAVSLSKLYGLVVFAGLFFDLIVYTMWLKRRTAWSIVWGGISGGMPILAGRTLGLGQLDWIGILLALAVLFWIPTHIMTFCMRYYDDYCTAKIPTFPWRYGFQVTRLVMSLSSILAALCIAMAAFCIRLGTGFLQALLALSGILILLAATSMVKSSEKLNFGLFKYASVYMLGAMILIATQALW